MIIVILVLGHPNYTDKACSFRPGSRILLSTLVIYWSGLADACVCIDKAEYEMSFTVGWSKGRVLILLSRTQINLPIITEYDVTL